MPWAHVGPPGPLELAAILHTPERWKAREYATKVVANGIRREGEGVRASRGDHDTVARKVSGWPKICKLAHAFLWEYSYKRLKSAQLLGQLGAFLTLVAADEMMRR